MRELNIDWAALHSAFQMNMPEVRCFLSLEDGRVLKLPPGDPLLATVRLEAFRYVLIDAIPSRIQYQWLDDFIESIQDHDTQQRLKAAINGKGAFRRFKDILLSMAEVRRLWFEYRDQKMRNYISDWVIKQNLSPLNDPPWLGEGADFFGSSLDEMQPGAHTGTHASFVSSSNYLPLHQANTARHGSYNTPSSSHLISNQAGLLDDHLPPPPTIIRHKSPQNDPRVVEDLRDFIIDWCSGEASLNTNPIILENLAVAIVERFQISLQH